MSTSPETTMRWARSCTSWSWSSSPAGSVSAMERASPRLEWRIRGLCGSTSRLVRSQCSMRPGRLLLLGLRAQAGDRLADQARYVHLRDADDVADLGLREVLLEAQAQHLALALGQHAHQSLDGRGVLRHGVAVVLGAEGVDELALLVLLAARAVERDGAVRAGGLARLEHLLGRRPHALADLGRRRRAAELAAHVLADAVDLDGKLLEVARHPHRPAFVTKVTLELAEDRRHRERAEGGLPLRVEALDRLEQPQRRDLDQVVERLAGALVAPRELATERKEPLDERL